MKNVVTGRILLSGLYTQSHKQKPNIQKKGPDSYVVSNRLKEEDDPAFCVPFCKLSQLPIKSRQIVNSLSKSIAAFPPMLVHGLPNVA